MRISFAELYNGMLLDPFWGADNEIPGYGRSGGTRKVLDEIYEHNKGNGFYEDFRHRVSRWPLRDDPHRHLIALWCGVMGLPTYFQNGKSTGWQREDFLEQGHSRFFVNRAELKDFLKKNGWPLPSWFFSPDNADPQESSKHGTCVLKIANHNAVPVRLIPYVAGWGAFPPNVVASILSGTETRLPGGTERLSLSSYHLLPNGTYQKMAPTDWDVILQDLKELMRDLHAEGKPHPVWRTKAIKTLLAGTFVWLQDLERLCEQTFSARLREKPDDHFTGHLNLTPYIPAELRNVVYAGFKKTKATTASSADSKNQQPVVPPINQPVADKVVKGKSAKGLANTGPATEARQRKRQKRLEQFRALLDEIVQAGQRQGEPWATEMNGWQLPFQVEAIAYIYRHKHKSDRLPKKYQLQNEIHNLGFQLKRANAKTLAKEKQALTNLLQPRR